MPVLNFVTALNINFTPTHAQGVKYLLVFIDFYPVRMRLYSIWSPLFVHMALQFLSIVNLRNMWQSASFVPSGNDTNYIHVR